MFLFYNEDPKRVSTPIHYNSDGPLLHPEYFLTVGLIPLSV
jgi:hypothetical protein